MAVHDLIKEYATQHQRIVFNGNGYAPEWEKEARRRGLPVLPSMVDAIPALTTDKAVELFGEFGVFTKTELESRAEIQYEIYAKALTSKRNHGGHGNQADHSGSYQVYNCTGRVHQSGEGSWTN